MKKTRGYLLLEALIALTLLGLGIATFVESSWIARQWIERSRSLRQMAQCLEEQAWLSLGGISMPSMSCNETWTVDITATAFSTSLVRKKLMIRTPQTEKVYESSIESFQPAR